MEGTLIPQEKVSEQRQLFARMTTEELREEFKKGLRLTAEHLTNMAPVLIELESRGIVMSNVEKGLLGLLRRIAYGTLLPEVVVKFASVPEKMKQIAKLSVEQQRNILNDETQLESLIRRKSHRRTDRPPSSQHSELERESPVKAARLASVRDLAETIGEMIAAHPEPKEVWQATLGQPVVNGFNRGATKIPKMDILALIELLIAEVEDLVPHKTNSRVSGRLSTLALAIEGFFNRAEKSTY